MLAEQLGGAGVDPSAAEAAEEEAPASAVAADEHAAPVVTSGPAPPASLAKARAGPSPPSTTKSAAEVAAATVGGPAVATPDGVVAEHELSLEESSDTEDGHEGAPPGADEHTSKVMSTVKDAVANEDVSAHEYYAIQEVLRRAADADAASGGGAAPPAPAPTAAAATAP